MGVRAWIDARRLAAFGVALAALLIAGIVAHGAVQADNAATIALAIDGCSDECNLDPGEDFTVNVDVTDAPDEGYVLVQTFLDYGPDLTYNQTDTPAEEVVWPDVSGDVIVRDSYAENTVLLGGLTGVVPPLPLSTYEGTVFSFSFTCSDEYSSTEIMQLPSGDPVAGTSGALFNLAGAVQLVPKVSNVTVNCGEAPPTPTPTSGGPGPTALPPTGTGSLNADQGGTSMVIWLAIGALLAAGVTGIGAFGLSAVRGRRD